MSPAIAAGGWLSSPDEEARAGVSPEPKASGSGWRESLQKLGQNDEHDSSKLPAAGVAAGGGAGGGWRSSVLAHSRAWRDPGNPQPEAVPGSVQLSQTLSKVNIITGERLSTPNPDVNPSVSGPTIVAGRLTANGMLSARQASVHGAGLPQPQRLRDSGPGCQPVERMAGGREDSAQNPVPPVDPAPAPQDFVSAFKAKSFHARTEVNSDTEEDNTAATPTADSTPRVGWRKAVGVMMMHDSTKDNSEQLGAASAVPAQSLWRSITKTFSSRSHHQDADSPTAHAATTHSSLKAARSMASFRAAATLSQSGSPKDVWATPVGHPEGRTVGGPTGEEEFQLARTSRMEAAADRAVREVDAEANAVRSDGQSDSNESPTLQKNASRKLRFNSSNLGSAHSSIGGHSVHNSANSRGQSFRERVANALGLGALMTRRSMDLGAEEEDPAMPSPQHRVQGVLKKEGTSKQLRLGLGFDDSEEGEEEDDKATSGSSYRAFKQEGASEAEGVQGAQAAHAVLRSQTGMVEDIEPVVAGRARPDSAVVPGRLHISTGQLDLPVQELEATLLSPSELLPPGEKLPHLRRPATLLAKVGDKAGATGELFGRAAEPRSASTLPQGQHLLREAVSFGGLRPMSTVAGQEPGARFAAVASAAASAAASVAASAMPSMTSKVAPSGVTTAAPPKARSTIKLPIITTGHWDSLVFGAVWRVGRVFGFQAFNPRPSTKDDAKREYVPAAIFVAADHLIQLLVKNGYVRRHRGEDTDDERFAKALFEFHSTIFYSYEMQWTKMQRLSPRAQRFTDDLRERVFSEHHIINGLLCELALYFLIFTESANIRFCPEAMWMVFWCMNHSYIMADLWNSGSPDRVTNARDRLPQLRNTHQHLIRELQVQICIRPADMRPEDCGKMSSILTRLSTTDVPMSDRELLADLVSYGDGGFFMDRIVTPIFYVMSYEIDRLSTLGVDTAHRLGYDDFNESLTCRDVVYGAILELRVTPYDIATGATNDAYQSLSSLGFLGRTVINNRFDPQVAAEWWRHRVFVKTYRERRSWWGIYRAFFRVYAFHMVLFHLMQAQAFAGWDWRVVSSAILTHAWLTWLERVANWMMTMPVPEPVQTTMTKIYDRKGYYKMDKVNAVQAPGRKGRGGAAVGSGNIADRLLLMKQTQGPGNNLAPGRRMSIKELQAMQPERVLEIEGAPIYGLFGGLLEWLIISTLLSIFYTMQFAESSWRNMALDYWGYVAAGYSGLHVVHFLLTTRDGYAISLTQALRLPSYFQNWSSRPQPRTWMYNDMKMNWKNFSYNVFFWLLVLAMKVPFDYFVIHKPVVKPIRLLLTANWLGCKGPVYRFPGGVTLPCVGGDWILVAARIVPFLIVALFDTALFYQFIVTAFGIFHGLIKLDLGVVSSWDDLVREFHKSPPRWWIRCMSFTGNDNQKNLLFHTISANAQDAANADETTGGEGEGGKKNVAISDGLMFKIKIVTPEEIKAKQGLMLKERKINMQAGKAGPSNEVEGKAVRAVNTHAPGTAANTRPGTTTNSVVAGRTDPRSSAAASGGGGGAGVQTEGAVFRPMVSRNGRAAAPLVGQDYKETHAKAAGTGGLFGWRGSAAGEAPTTGTRSSLTGLLPNIATVDGSSGGAPGGRSGGRRGSATGDGAPQGGGVKGMMKTLGTSALAAALLARKNNQVQPAPVAESLESSPELDPRRHSLSDTIAAAITMPPRTRAALQQTADSRTARHPAWQPEELLGPAHADYDPASDPMSHHYRPERQRGGEHAPSRQWRFWPWRHKPQDEPHSRDAVVAPGPAFASLRVHGWKPETEIEVWQEEEANDDDATRDVDADTELPHQQRRGQPGGARVQRGPVGEGVTLVGPDGRPLQEVSDSGIPSDGEPAEARCERRQPFVLLSEVPVMRVDSDRSGSQEPSSGRVSFNVDGAGAGGHDGDDDDGDGELDNEGRGGRIPGSVRFTSNKFKGLTVSLSGAFEEDNADLGAPKAARAKKNIFASAPARQQRGAGLFSTFFKSKPGGGDMDEEDEDMAGKDRGRAGDASAHGRERGRDVSVHGRERGRDVSVHGKERSRAIDASVHSKERSRAIDASVHSKDRSVRSGIVGRHASVGPAAAGFGIQRQKSMTGSALLNRKASFAASGTIQRVKSISAAGSTNFEQKQFAKKWERQHSVAAQVVKRDLATRTTSMVLMGTEDLQNMEEDELDVVSEQMMMWSSFAEAWDAICDDLRDGDLISDKEMDLLKFVRLESSGKLHGLRPILLPTFFFAGQIRKVVDTGRVTTAQVMVLTEFRVLITWLACQLGIMSGKHAHVIMTTSLYGGIINVKHINMRKKSFDSAIELISLVEQAIRKREVPFDIKDFAEHLLAILNGLESECYAVQKMWELGRVSEEELDGALTLFEVVQDMQERVRQDPEGLKQCLKRAVAMEDLITNTNVLLQVTTVLRQMLTTTSADATPQGEEAQRVLGFFINSLGHPSLDKPQSLEFMLSWSVLTPAYEEDVLYAVDSGLSAEELGLPKKRITDLLSETDDGFSLMAYLRAMFAFEWSNFKERMRRLVGHETEVSDWGQITELDFGPGGIMFDYRTELQLWASYRGQLLARTVRGMMCYERALKVLCRMEYPTPLGITDADYERWVDAMVASKFEYVIAVQTYGRNAKSSDLRLRQLSQGVDILVQRFPTLKVAYLDAVDDERYGPTQYSVLIRNRRASDPIADPTRPFNKIVEAYRIRLPYNRYSNRGVVLGEGKPENQNHASVFAFNEGLQAIDMNQDNYLAEALKMRNLLSELNPSNRGAQFMLFADDSPTQVLSPHMTAAELRFVILSRMKRSFPTAIVGFREWIFSANTGALGQYAAATEYSFATIQSRIMTKPARVRMHYGHPDVFNKLHVMTRGGMSKGTRTLHISEDYFIGAAHTLRGGRIRYKEYISCGKGRDMGFDSILGYQKKISGGAGDLATSREVHRLGTRLDFFRLMSFYHGGVGHFLNSYLTLKAAWYNIWALLLTAMAGAMELGLKGTKGEVTLTQTYNVQQVLQLGTLAIIPYVGQLILETGLLRTLITVFGQIITGSLFFYIFQQQTVAASFSSVMAFGGMRYIGTGRGFSIQTTDFVKMYTMYARTHLYLGFEVLFFCVTLYALDDCTTCNYGALTWNSWLLAFVMLLCPLWFNPFIFNLSKVQRDYMSWKRWLNGDMDAGTSTNWYTWNREQLSQPRNDDGNVTDAWRNAFREIMGTCLPFSLLVLAMVSRIDFRVGNKVLLDSPYVEFLMATALLWCVVLCMSYLGHNLLERAKSKEWRIIRYGMTLTAAVLLIVYMVVLSRFYTGDGFRHLMQVAYANLVILIMVHRAATYLMTQNNTVRDFVDAGYYMIDVLVGYAMFGMLALLSFVGIVNLLQSKLLFNEAFSQSVQTARIKMQVKRSGKQIKRKAKPGLLMTMEEWMRSRPASAASAAPSLPATVYDGGVSRAVSLAPSMLPSAVTSVAPSAAASAAASAFTSAANSGIASRRDSLSELMPPLVNRTQPSQPGMDAELTGTGAGEGSAGVTLDGGGNDGGLRERRLRFE